MVQNMHGHAPKYRTDGQKYSSTEYWYIYVIITVFDTLYPKLDKYTIFD